MLRNLPFNTPFLSLVLLFCLCTQGLSAQLEGYASVGTMSVANENASFTNEAYPGKTGWTVGSEVFVGKSQFAPFLGAYYQRLKYVPALADREKLVLEQISVPVGFAYFLRPRTTSFNLMASAAFAPVLSFNDPVPEIVSERGLVYSLRGGLVLTLDYLFLGTHLGWYPDGRFGTTDKWTTYQSYFVGVRF